MLCFEVLLLSWCFELLLLLDLVERSVVWDITLSVSMVNFSSLGEAICPKTHKINNYFGAKNAGKENLDVGWFINQQ
jgi:hypothetical protein